MAARPKKQTTPPIFLKYPKWQEMARHYFQQLEDRTGSKNTRKTYEGELRAFFASGKNPDEYTRADVLNHINAPSRGPRNRGQPPTPGTYNSRLTRIKSLYGFAEHYKVKYRSGLRALCQNNPTEGINFVQEDETFKGMTGQELVSFFSVIPRDSIVGLRDFAIFLFYFWSGRRLNEVVRLRFCDIELCVFEDGRAGWRFHFRGKGKSRISKTAELVPVVKQALDAYWEAADRLPMPQDAPLFAATQTMRTHKPMHARTFDARFHKYEQLAGLAGRGYSIHSLRWTAAGERYDRNGHDIVAVSEYLGHASVDMTRRYLRRRNLLGDKDASRLLADFGNL